MDLGHFLLPLSAGGAIAVIGAIAVVMVAVQTYQSYNRLRHIPGPWYSAITPIWLGYHTLKCDVYRAMYATIHQYGSVARIAPNMIVTDDPVLYRTMTAARAPFLRGHWFQGMKLDPRIDNILSTTDENRHADIRAKLMPGYSGKDVVALETDIDAEIQNLLELVRKHVDNNDKFDFAVFASYFTLDSLSQIAFSHASGFLRNNRDMYDYFKTTKAFFPIMELGCNIPFVMKLLNSQLVQTLAGPKPSDQVGLGAIMGQAHAEVATRFGPNAKEQKDMLGSFIQHGVTQKECESESVIQILAGSDSTATALRVTFWHIISTPIVYRKLKDEFVSAIETGRVSFPVIKDIEAKQLPYLQACIKEGLRMFMPLNGLATRVCPPGGYVHNGMHIPEGTEIGVSIYTMLRRTDIFGPDADTFRPERFLETPPEALKELERVQDHVFGFGRSSCLGKGIAQMELGKAIFELLRSFDYTIVNPLEAVISRSSGVVVQENMFMRAWPISPTHSARFA